MNPIDVTRRLKEALIRYLLTTFDVNRDGENELLYGAMREAFEADRALITGPFLELALPYQRGQSVKELVDIGLLSRKMLSLPNPPIPVDAPLYLHQERAIKRLIASNNVIVSSGTGSGKTEVFMIPILNDLLQNPAQGVRAILIYPLNALVNDQLDRLGKLLQGTNITYGRYTSELAQTTQDWKRATGKSEIPVQQVISREQIRNGEKIPNILITNYAMLEYLLLRPNEFPLFLHADDWKYIVLDEAHSYSGAKGIEVAYLIRRLKHHLGKARGEMICIGTSATLTDEPDEAIKFAETLFGEDFALDDIIFGESINEENTTTNYTPPTGLNAYLAEGWDELLEKARTNTATIDEVWDTLSKFKLIDNNASIEPDSLSTLLYGALKNNAHLQKLRAIMMSQPDVPLGLKEAAKQLFPDSQSDPVREQDSIRALYHLIELGAIARPHPDQATLLPARFHLFARSPQGMWVCLNPDCKGRPEGHTESWSKLFGSPRLECDDCGCAVFPLSVCRNCGQVYVKTLYVDGQHWAETQKLEGETPRYFVWSRQEINEALGDEIDEDQTDEVEPPENPTQIESTPTKICVNAACRRDSRCTCARDGRTPHHITLYSIIKQTNKGKLGSKSEPVFRLECCARCGSKSRIKDEEIATPITMQGMTPLSVLTMELYRHLPESYDTALQQKPGAGRKLLSFYDSRQGAARYAAFLQDVFNQDLLRYLIPQALSQLAGKEDVVTLNHLAEKATSIGWDDLHVFQNSVDDEIDQVFNGQAGYQYRAWIALTREQRNDLIRFTKARILAEITTGRRGRQSLESLGLIRVQYFETEPDVSTLASEIGLTVDQTRTVIHYLLDTLRNQKSVSLPDRIDRDHPAFGRHKGNASIVRGTPSSGEAPWVGATERHGRCRIMALALKAAGRASDYEAVKTALLAVWEWLIDAIPGLMNSNDQWSYRLSTSHLFLDAPSEGWHRCDKCQRLRHGKIALPCPEPRCGGIYHPIDHDMQREKNYYHYIFRQGLKPMRAEEHTAQLTPEKAQQYQNYFKKGDINVLSCSTTFEMGIDLGDLQAVVMNNVPPNVSNYRQRAGRAGRRAGGTAFIVTWARDRPHDQFYFDAPPEIIRGQVRIPRLTLENKEIQRRHLNALLLGDFLHFLHQQKIGELDKVGAFFDVQEMNNRHYNQLADWERANLSGLTRKLNTFAALIQKEAIVVEEALSTFGDNLATAEEVYSTASTLYRRQIEEAIEQYAKTTAKQAEEWHKQRKEAEKRLERLIDDPLIDTLSERGVLPSYSFPLYTVELELPYQKQEQAQLRLQRDLRQALTEFAPGAEIVADKRLWKSNGVLIRREARQIFEYRLCRECNHILAPQVAGAPLLEEECPTCGTPYRGKGSNTRYLVPDGFSTDPDSGKMAGQYVHYESTQQSVAVEIPSTNTNGQPSDFVHRSVQTNGRLYYLNGGRNGLGYKLCSKCGRHITAKNGTCPNKMCGGQGQYVHLGHAVPTDTLLIQFRPPPNVLMPGRSALDFWTTLQTALVLGATHALQIERGDIGGTLFPIRDGWEWQRSLVLFDNVPGGAGYMHDIDQHFTEVVEAALALVHCPYCTEDTSCTRCLRDYGNQMMYPLLKRGRVISFLENLYAYLTAEVHPLGRVPLIANNRVDVLWEAITSAKKSIRLAMSRVEDVIPLGKNRSWLDVIYDQLRNGVAVQLLLSQPPIPDYSHVNLIEADYLSLMMTKGQRLNLRQTSALPTWHIIVDAEDDKRAIQFDDIVPKLSSDLSNPRLFTTSQMNGVRTAVEEFDRAFEQARIVSADTLKPPATTIVHRIQSSGRRTSEAQIPAILQFFERPVAQMTVSDPYLVDYERIVNRLGTYIQLAYEQGDLSEVKVITRDAQLEGYNRDKQKQAFDKLRERFPNLTLDDKRRTDRQEHDRWIEIIRSDNSKALMYIGRGLDFIRPDGTVQATYIVTKELG